MGPVSLLDRTSKYVRFFMLPKAGGRDPVRFFMLLKSSRVRCVSFDKDGDIVPVKVTTINTQDNEKFLIIHKLECKV